MTAAMAGCATSGKMSEVSTRNAASWLMSPEQAKQLERKITDQDIANVLDAHVKPKLPTAIAIARLDSERGDQLTPLGHSEVKGWERAMAGQSQILGIRTVTTLADEDSRMSSHSMQVMSLHSLRASAAGMGCELSLVYIVAHGEVDNFNDAALLYWTIVGLFTVPGSEFEHKTVMQAVLVDCRTGVILGTANGDGRAKQAYVPAAGDIVKDRLRAATPQQALNDLQKNTAIMVNQVIAAPAVAAR